MAFVRTVRGDVDASSLGFVNAHEHLAIVSGLIVQQHPDYRLNDTPKAIEEVADFADCGGGAIVDATPCGVGREPDALLAIAQSTGVHVIAATGLHKDSYYLDSHWRFRYTAEQMAEQWQADIEIGMERSGYEGPIVDRSQARAGVIKVASDYQNISSASQKAFEAAALAHTRTGAPILTHSEIGTMMLEQIMLLQTYGVAPNKVIISHGDRNPDWFLHRDVAQTGAFIEYDLPGRIKYFPESTVIDLLRRMFELSLGDHVLLGGDNARRSYWKAYGGGPGMAHILRSFIPRLAREGFTEDQIHQLGFSNPAAALAFSLVSDELVSDRSDFVMGQV